MKKIYVFIAAIALLTVACRKETGTDNTLKETKTNETVETNNAQAPCYGNDWDLDADYPNNGIALVYNNKIYVPDKVTMTVKIFDGNSWTSISSAVPFYTFLHEGANNHDIVAFTIGNKGYMFLPYNPDDSHVDVIGFWEYNFASNTWTRKADFPGVKRDSPAYFTIGTKGYVVGGSGNRNDTWEYNQVTNSWTQKASLGHIGRSSATGFSIGSKGYILGGRAQFPNGPIFFQDLLEYNPSTNSWTMKASFPGGGRAHPAAFVISDRTYAGGGFNLANDSFQDFYKYSPATNSWTTVADLPLDFRTFFGFSINSRGYVIQDFGSYGNGMLKYTPAYCFPWASL